MRIKYGSAKERQRTDLTVSDSEPVWTTKKTAEMQNQCAEIKIRAERKAGEMLRENVKAGNPQLLHRAIIRPKLNEIGINRIQSHR